MSSSPDTTTVRKLVEQDLLALMALYQQLHLEGASAAPAILDARWREILRQPWIVHLGVFAGDALVSTCHAVIVPNLTHQARSYAVIEGVVTDQAHRRRGYGALAMRSLIGCCWEADCYKVSLTSGAQRGEAHEFYRRLGFVTGTKQAFVLRR